MFLFTLLTTALTLLTSKLKSLRFVLLLIRKKTFVFLVFSQFSICYQQQGSAATEIEMERLKLDYKKSIQMNDQWQKNYENLLQVVMEEELNGGSN